MKAVIINGSALWNFTGEKPKLLNVLLNQPKIFIIDDDRDDSEMLSSALEAEGIKIKSFNSGEKAIAHLRDNSEYPTMIIMDYNMPRQNGEEIMRSIKSNPSTSSIPVVIFSTYLSDVFKSTLIQSGADYCFKKPFSYNNFLSQVNIFKDLADSLITERA